MLSASSLSKFLEVYRLEKIADPPVVLLARFTVTVSVQVPSVAGLTAQDRRLTGSARCCAIGIIDSAIARRRYDLSGTGTAMAVPAAVFAVIVATV